MSGSELRLSECLELAACHAQLRCVRRLLGQLEDDLGDLTLALRRVETEAECKEVGDAQDLVTETSERLRTLQERLHVLSREVVA